MMRQMNIATPIMALALLVAFAALACGSSSNDESSFSRESAAGGVPGLPGNPGSPGYAAFAPAPIAPQMPSAPAAPAPAAPAPKPAPAPAATAAPAPRAEAVQKTLSSDAQRVVTQTTAGGPEAQFASQRRIIIRTVDMLLVVPDVAASLDAISDLAKRFEGWVVSSNRSLNHRGSISIRVPSDQLDDVILQLRGMAEEVESEVSTSKDVTDEYVDLQSRLTNQRATESALLKLLDRAETVEAALSVQQSLTRVQEEIERMQGRIKFLEETSAFSLVNVQLKLAPSDMPVDAGDDQTVSIRTPARFRATFDPPEGIDDFGFTWDFGDGSEPVFSNRTAPTTEEGRRVTATVTHFYTDVKNSPYIVEIKMTGTGDDGVTEGSDILTVTVTDIPTVEVFAGEGFVVDQGEEARFSGSFTRPEGLTNVNYKWDFGDGTAPETGPVAERVTRIETTHTYKDFRPFPYQAVLTITADSEVGEVEVSSPVTVVVKEKPAWTVAGWDPGDTGRTAVRTLSGVGAGLAIAGIWIGIFSPVWIVAGGLIYAVRRRWRGRPEKPSAPEAAPPEA